MSTDRVILVTYSGGDVKEAKKAFMRAKKCYNDGCPLVVGDTNGHNIFVADYRLIPMIDTLAITSIDLCKKNALLKYEVVLRVEIS